ncbi:MAG: response regulator transcription factor [Chloroflexota bacterium]|nr:response regulator transcription factor [Chloroflexota bacterium]
MRDAQTIRVLIVDDHRMVRSGLRGFLEGEPGITVAGEAESGEDAIAGLPALTPDVVLMDLMMPGIGGIAAIDALRHAYPSLKIMALTSFADDEQVFPALEAGANGYLLKDIDPDELVAAIRAVYAGESPLDPEVAKRLVSRFQRPATAPTDTRASHEALTERECDVLRLLIQGKSNKEIAHALFIGDRTVKSHLSAIFQKLDVTDRTQAALYAVRHGLVSNEQ